MVSGADKLSPISVAFAQERGAKVLDTDGDGFVDAGDSIILPTFHRRADGPRRSFVLPVTEETAQDLVRIFASPPGFRLWRSPRFFGDARGFVNYTYQLEQGKISVDQIQVLVASAPGSCKALDAGTDEPEIRDCAPFEQQLFVPNAVNTVPFIVEQLLIERHMASVAELARLQSELAWFNATEGRDTDFLSTYQGYEFLFSPDAINTVDLLIGDLESKRGDARRLKELRFYRSYLVSRWLGRQVASYAGAVDQASAMTPVEIEWLGMTVPFEQLDQLIAREEDADRRRDLLQRKAAILRDVFNPIILERSHRLVSSIGRFHDSYLDYVRELRHMEDVGGMIGAAGAFFAKTDTLYRRLLEREAKRQLGRKPAELRRPELLRIISFGAFDPFFPPQLMTDFMQKAMQAMGFDLGTKGKARITINDFAHPRKDPTPQCIVVDAPDDVRISYRPKGGIGGYEQLFHEIGHALHYANAEAREWAFLNIGDATATETYATLFASLVTDPAFLERYRAYVHDWNLRQPADDRLPELGPVELGQIVRLGALRDFYMVRRYNYAKVTYEVARMGAEAAVLRRAGIDPEMPTKALYASLFERAYGVPMEEWEVERYMLDSDDDLYAADYARAFVLRPQFAEELRSEYGERWFENPDAGAWLRQEFFVQGSFLTPADLKKEYDFDAHDYRALERDLRWRIRAAESLEQGRGLPKRP